MRGRYDDAGELSQISYTHGASTDDVSYGYDPSGRRTAVWGTYGRITLPAATTSTAVYDLGNRLTSWNGATVVNDNNGNLTSDGTFTYTYNPRNQLTLVKQGNQTRGSYTYDGVGRRVVRTTGNSTTKPAYDGWNLVQERASNGNSVTANYLTGLGLDEPLLRTAGHRLAITYPMRSARSSDWQARPGPCRPPTPTRPTARRPCPGQRARTSSGSPAGRTTRQAP